jgi:AAA+ ATPase superfamily predicted ATPase
MKFYDRKQEIAEFYIDDCFLMFWFRFVESNRSLVERGKFELLAEKYNHIKKHLRGYKVELIGLSMQDM